AAYGERRRRRRMRRGPSPTAGPRDGSPNVRRTSCQALVCRHCPGLSCAGRSASRTRVNALMPRASIEKKRFNRSGWIAGSSPAMTTAGSLLVIILVAARTGGAQRRTDALRRRRQLVAGDADRGEGIVDGVDDRRRRADGAALTQPLRLGDGRWRQRLEMMDFDRRDLSRGRRQIIRETRRENISGLIVDDLLEQRVGDALGNAAVDLPVDDHGIDQASG